MQDCKECIHNRVCAEFSRIGLFPNCKASSIIQKRVIDKDCDCEHFRKEIYGKWISYSSKWLDCFMCNKCGVPCPTEKTDKGCKDVLSKFCPKCGVRMINGK